MLDADGRWVDPWQLGERESNLLLKYMVWLEVRSRSEIGNRRVRWQRFQAVLGCAPRFAQAHLPSHGVRQRSGAVPPALLGYTSRPQGAERAPLGPATRRQFQRARGVLLLGRDLEPATRLNAGGKSIDFQRPIKFLRRLKSRLQRAKLFPKRHNGRVGQGSGASIALLLPNGSYNLYRDRHAFARICDDTVNLPNLAQSHNFSLYVWRIASSLTHVSTQVAPLCYGAKIAGFGS